MTVKKVLLGFAVVLAVLVLACLCVVWLEKNCPSKEYDERQKQVQGKAYRFAFLVGGCYYIVLWLWRPIFGEEIPFEGSSLVLLGLFIEGVAFEIYCLLNNAALPLGNKGGRQMVFSCSAFCILNILKFRSQLKSFETYKRYLELEPDPTLPVPEINGDTWMTLIIAMVFGVLARIYLYSLLRTEKE